MNNRLLIRLLLLCALVVAAALGLIYLPVKDSLAQFVGWVRGLGDWGPVVLAVAYIPACLFFVPGTILTFGGGFAFGLVKGTIAVSLGSVAGAAAAFLNGRFLARGLIEEKVARHPRFHAIDQAVAEQGFKIVLLTRLSPVFPFNLLNYAFGLTKVRFRDYVLASWIGMFPATVLYVYVGSLAGELADLVAGKAQGGIAQQVLFGVGLLATVIVTVFVTRVARQALDRAVPVSANGPSPSGEPHE